MVFSQILKSCRSSLIKNYKSWQKSSQKAYFKDIKFLIKIRDIHKDEKNPSALAFLVMKIRKNTLCIKKLFRRKTC